MIRDNPDLFPSRFPDPDLGSRSQKAPIKCRCIGLLVNFRKHGSLDCILNYVFSLILGKAWTPSCGSMLALRM
jgi:hypothetical protein